MLYLIKSSSQLFKIGTMINCTFHVRKLKHKKLGDLPQASQAENDGAWSENQTCVTPKLSHEVLAGILIITDHKNYHYY